MAPGSSPAPCKAIALKLPELSEYSVTAVSGVQVRKLGDIMAQAAPPMVGKHRGKSERDSCVSGRGSCASTGGRDASAVSSSAAPGGCSMLSGASVRTLLTLVEINGEEHKSVTYLKDLHGFCLELEEPLELAAQLLQSTDHDIATALRNTYSEALGVIDCASGVLMKYAIISHEISYGVLPSLEAAARKAKRHAAASLLGVAQGQINEMRKEAEEAKLRYVQLLDHVNSLIQCTQLSLDLASGNEMDLQSALEELEKAHELLLKCSSFWHHLFSTGQDLALLEQDAQNVRGQLLGSGEVTRGESSELCMQFCKSLGQLCQQFCRFCPRSNQAPLAKVCC